VNFGKGCRDTEGVMASMNKALRHRGPDGEGIFTSKDDNAVLGARRLGIVDVKRGHQPMTIDREGKQFSIVFNGEIYNHKELRGRLEQEGHRFETDSDTEVALRSYMEWGERCLKRFRGIYAIAIYDEAKLFLARDRLGVKPLYYSESSDGSLVFSSESKGVLKHPGVRKEPDLETIAEYFLGSFVFTDSSASLERSFFKGVFSLEPGTYSVFGPSGMRSGGYWDLPIYGERSDIDFAGELRRRLMMAVIEQVPDEVRFGTLLSGGLDSSIVTAIAARHSPGGFVSSTIRYIGQENNPDFDHARSFAHELGLDLLVGALTPESLVSDIDPMIRAMDEPHDTIRQLGLFAAYRTLHDAGCKVALVGEGSDEFNLGYYRSSPGFGKDLCANGGAFREAWRKRIRHASRYFTRGFLRGTDFNAIIERNTCGYYEKCESERPIDRIQYYYAKKFLKYRLDANDRCSMAHSIEARVPFCDHRFVRRAFEVPPEMNLRGGSEKQVLREAFRGLIPEKILTRRKFALPECQDLRLYELIADGLDRNIRDADPRIWEILDKDYIAGLNVRFKDRIKKAREEGGGARTDFTGEIRMSEEIGLRVKHVFLALTFLRWFDINFVSG